MTDAQKQHIETYKSIIEQVEGVELKGKTMPYTSTNGHMFSQLNKDGEIGIRLSKERQSEFFSNGLQPFKSYGAVMQGYILVSEEMLSNIDQVVELMKEGLEYVQSLEPK
ncbi:MAG: hypothetical protein ACMZ7B_11375 [Balneola sp.]